MDRLTNKKGLLKGNGCCYGWMSYDCSGDGRERLKDALEKLAAFEGFGKEMKYDKKITIHHNNHLGYRVYEQYMYSRTKTLVSTKRYKDVVDTLKLKLLN